MPKSKSKKKKNEEQAMDVDVVPDAEQNESGIVDHISDDEDGGVHIGDIYIPPAPKPALTFDPTGPRLIITHIVNENFKSYAGVQTLGPFHKSFTAIIGPNGSGKSNVIDSMLFVFGYRATKIRSKKISVLLHSSRKFNNVKSASVAVHFCQIIDGEGEEYTMVPGSELVVSRTAFKDNTSFYSLNGRRVHFKEVNAMLRSHGIDLAHNRFLILQGEVEQISMMRPKGLSEHDTGMLEYLEDIIGTSRYKEPIDTLSEKVEEYTELRKEKLNRVRLVESEKQKLEQPMQEAVQLINLTNAALRTRNALLQKYIYETDKIIETKEQERQEAMECLTKIDEKLIKMREDLQEKSRVLNIGTQKYDSLQKQKEEKAEKLRICNNKTVGLQNELSQSKTKKKNLTQLLQQQKGKLIELELVPDKNRREIDDCKTLLVKLNESKEQAETALQTALAAGRAQTEELQQTEDELNTKLINLKSIAEAKNKIFTQAELELKSYLTTEFAEAATLEKVKEQYDKVSDELVQKKALLEELSATVPADEKQLSEMQTKLQNLKREEKTVGDETKILRAELETNREAMSANRSRGRVLDALMKEKRNGTLHGIFGRLGDLGGIDSKYDVAISTCCAALDSIVNESVDSAQACLEHLKRHNIGRATFIALDRQQHLKRIYEQRCSFPENVPRLFDLVTVKDPRVLPAFYYALRDTLVAKDLEQATRIAYGQPRYRVVTLRGEVIEIAGTMAGGGKSVTRGRMASSVQQDTREQDPREIQNKENRLTTLQQRLSEIRSEHSTLENTVEPLQRKTRTEKNTLHKLNYAIKSLTEQLNELKDKVKNQEDKVASSKVDPEKKARLETTRQAAEECLAKVRRDTEEAEAAKREVRAKITAIRGTKVKVLEKKLDDLTKQITKIPAEITKLTVAIATSERNANRLKDQIKAIEIDLKETEKNFENTGNQKKQLTLESSQLEREIEELTEQITEGTNEFSGLRQEISKLQNKENKTKSERCEAFNAVNTLEKSLNECRGRKPQWERELASLKLEEAGVEGVPGAEPPEPLQRLDAAELGAAAVDELRARLAAQRARLGDARPNVQAILDYKAKEELFLRRASELDEITRQRNEMRALFEQLKKKRTTDFLTGFNTITGKLKEMYQMITLGGDAELELVDSLDPFTEGIIFSVRPPNKSWKNISNLSGGEKTLSSLALVFALHYYKPTPLYVMDEIDAALDFKNVSIVANYIKERTKNAQFIIISLRYNMFELGNRLVGIYKTQDCTKSVTIDNKLPDPNSPLAF